MRHAVIPRTMSFIFHKDKLLFFKANGSKVWAGMYGIIGGHVEKGEDILKAVQREILEETGLTLPDTKLMGIINNVCQ